MTDMVLDLSSKPAMMQPKIEAAERNHEFGGSSDSGRASIGSESSEHDPRDEQLSDREDGSSKLHTSMGSNHSLLASPGHSSGEEEKKCDTGDRINPVRPFKMYPMDPFSVYSNPLMASAAAASAAGFSPSMAAGLPGMPGMGNMATPIDSPLGLTLTPLTSHFLQRKRRQDGRESDSAAAKKAKSVPVDKKDDCYWERRRKNNDAAKRSRDSRRQKEEEIAMRAAFLEQENLKLRAQVAILKNETTKLHYMLYNRV